MVNIFLLLHTLLYKIRCKGNIFKNVALIILLRSMCSLLADCCAKRSKRFVGKFYANLFLKNVLQSFANTHFLLALPKHNYHEIHPNSEKE